MSNDYVFNDTLPVAPLKIAALESCRDLAEKVNSHIINFRRNDIEVLKKRQENLQYRGYDADSYMLDCACPRFGSGEAKGIVNESVRGTDIYAMVDVTNYSLTYKMSGFTNHMSPDDHYQDLKRIIGASIATAHRVNVIMPFLYEGRQHKRSKRESLDCALALQELTRMGVSNIITFDAHDPRVQNAIPLSGFESIMPTYQMLKAMCHTYDDLRIDKHHMMVISPDEGALNRNIYYSSAMGVDMGMFYKRRDYTRIVNGRNPIVAHEYMGKEVNGKDVFVADDILSSGESMIEVAHRLKELGANRIFSAVTFPLFTNGLDLYQKSYDEGLIDGVISTNLTYRTPELQAAPWFIEADMSKYISYIIATLNHDRSLSKLLSPYDRVHNLMNRYKQEQEQG